MHPRPTADTDRSVPNVLFCIVFISLSYTGILPPGAAGQKSPLVHQ